MPNDTPENYGLETLEKADEIKTIRELRQSLQMDVIRVKAEAVVQILRDIIKGLPAKPPMHAWGNNPETSLITSSISMLRMRLEALAQN